MLSPQSEGALISAGSGLLGVVVGGVVAYLKDRGLQRKLEQKDRLYLAVRVSSLLDRYVDAAIDVANDGGALESLRGAQEERITQTKAPTFEPNTLDVNWKSLDAALLAEILDFPSLGAAANRDIAAEMEYAASPPDYEEYFEERRIQYATLASSAQRLADRLRRLARISNESDKEQMIQTLVAEVSQVRQARIAKWAASENSSSALSAGSDT